MWLKSNHSYLLSKRRQWTKWRKIHSRTFWWCYIVDDIHGPLRTVSKYPFPRQVYHAPGFTRTCCKVMTPKCHKYTGIPRSHLSYLQTECGLICTTGQIQKPTSRAVAMLIYNVHLPHDMEFCASHLHGDQHRSVCVLTWSAWTCSIAHLKNGQTENNKWGLSNKKTLQSCFAN